MLFGLNYVFSRAFTLTSYLARASSLNVHTPSTSQTILFPTFLMLPLTVITPALSPRTATLNLKLFRLNNHQTLLCIPRDLHLPWGQLSFWTTDIECPCQATTCCYEFLLR